jgi:hypothetical protein
MIGNDVPDLGPGEASAKGSKAESFGGQTT